MWFLVVGVLLLALKLGEVSPVVGMSWFWVLFPFALAVLWWAWADKMGYTQKAEMDRLDARKEARRRKALEALGMDPDKIRRSRRK